MYMRYNLSLSIFMRVIVFTLKKHPDGLYMAWSTEIWTTDQNIADNHSSKETDIQKAHIFNIHIFNESPNIKTY